MEIYVYVSSVCLEQDWKCLFIFWDLKQLLLVWQIKQ